MALTGAVVMVALSGACSSGDSEKTAKTDDTSVQSETTASVTPTTLGSRFAKSSEVMAAINAGGVACNVTKSDEPGGGGASSVGFCEIGGHRLQVVTFASEGGKQGWLDFARDIKRSSFPGQEYVCVVGADFAACPDPGAGSTELAGRIKGAVGGDVEAIE